MFEEFVPFSEALGTGLPGLLPAFGGCPDCATMRMISAPALGRCPDCGAELAVLGKDETMRIVAAGLLHKS